MGYAEKLGGWINTNYAATTASFYTYNGVTRSLTNWITLAGDNLLGFGTTQQYYIQNNIGTIYNDITPTAYTASLLGTSFSTMGSVSNPSPVVKISNAAGSFATPTSPNAGLDVGSVVYFYSTGLTANLSVASGSVFYPGHITQVGGSLILVGGTTPYLTINGVTLYANYPPKQNAANTLANPYTVISVDRQIITGVRVSTSGAGPTYTATLTGTSLSGTLPLAGTTIYLSNLGVFNGSQVVDTRSVLGQTITITFSTAISATVSGGTATWIDSFQVIGSGTATVTNTDASIAALAVTATYLPNVGDNTTIYSSSGSQTYTKRAWSQASFEDDLVFAIQGNPIYYWAKDTTNWTPATTLAAYANTQQYQQVNVTSTGTAVTTFTVDFNDYVFPGQTISIASGSGSIPASPTKILSIAGLQVTVDNPVTVYSGGQILTGVITSVGSGYNGGSSGTYTGVSLLNRNNITAGSGAIATLTVTSGQVTGVSITTSGQNYNVGDVLYQHTGGPIVSGTTAGKGIISGTIAAGYGYTDGIYTNVPFTNVSSSGTYGEANITVVNGVIVSVFITKPGTGYAVGDVLTDGVTFGSGIGFTYTVTAVGAAGTGTGYTNGAYTGISLTNITGNGSGAIASITVASNSITAVTITTAGTGYNVGDVLSATGLGLGSGFTWTVTSTTGLGVGSGFSYTVATVTTASVLNLSYSGQFVPSQTNKLYISPVYQFVIALGANPYDPTNANTTFDPLLVRWSDQANPYQWIPQSSNQSGEQPLGNGSRLVTAVTNLQIILIFTDTAVYQMQYVGAPYVFSFTLLQDNISIISQNAAITANNVTWWMGTDKFYAFSGSVQAIPCPVRRFVFSNLNKQYAWQTVAGYNEGFSEVWWFYTSNNSTVNNSYVKYNFADQVWDYGFLNRTAWLGVGTQPYPVAAISVQATYLTAGVTNSVSVTSFPVADTSSFPSSGVLKIGPELVQYTAKTATSFTVSRTVSYASIHAAYDSVTLVTPNQLAYHEYGVDDRTVPGVILPILSYIQSSDFGIMQADGDTAAGNSLFAMNRCIPDLTFTGSSNSSATITFTIYPRLNPGSNYGNPVDTPTVTSTLTPPEEQANPPEQYTGQPSKSVSQLTAGQGQIYTRVRGRTIAFKVDTGDPATQVIVLGYPLTIPANSLGTMWQLGLLRFDVRKDGRR
jgi:hypothetical protein